MNALTLALRRVAVSSPSLRNALCTASSAAAAPADAPPTADASKPQLDSNSVRMREAAESPRLPGAEKQPARWDVPEEECGTRLDRFVKRRAPGVPPGLIQRLIRQRQVRVNGVAANHSAHAVRSGDAVLFPGWVKLGLSRGKRRPPADDLSLAEAQTVRSWVLHRDARTAVLNKPPGIPVTPSPSPSPRGADDAPAEREDGALATRSVHALLPALGTGRYWVVHRLDAAASGALVLARDVGAAGLLSEAFRSHRVARTYWALVSGRPRDQRGLVDMELDGKAARTEYEVVRDVGGQFSWLCLRPRTGRKHQLRAHCALALGCPIVGDEKYGAGGSAERAKTRGRRRGALPGPRHDDAAHAALVSSLGAHGQGLHLLARDITYPVLTDVHAPRWARKKGRQDKFVTVTAPLPPHMADSWRRFGLTEDMAEMQRTH